MHATTTWNGIPHRLTDETTDEHALVRAAQVGDRSAWSALYHRHARLVHGVVLARVPVEAAGDLVQEVFLQAFARVHDLREPAAFAGWLVTIARRRAADWRRRRRDTDELQDDVPAPATDPDASLDAARVLAALRRLPEAYRETLLLRLVEGLNGPEIAERTGLTPGSVRVNLHRGMERLRRELGWEANDAS